MKRKTVLIVLLIVGVLLCTGPLWGFLVTMNSMMNSFQKISDGPVRPQDVAGELQAAVQVTVAGWIALPLGAAMVISTALLLAGVRRNSHEVHHGVTENTE